MMPCQTVLTPPLKPNKGGMVIVALRPSAMAYNCTMLFHPPPHHLLLETFITVPIIADGFLTMVSMWLWNNSRMLIYSPVLPRGPDVGPGLAMP